jgi:hypothetical protein
MKNVYLSVVLAVLAAISAIPAHSSGAASTVWLEAEWFDGAQGHAQEDASGGSIAITNLGASPAVYDVKLPVGEEFRVWVRVADVLQGGRRGVVRLNGEASPPLSGSATGLTWYEAGKASGGDLKIELTGIETSPADCLYDAVLITDGAGLDGDAIAGRQTALRSEGWGGRGPRVALLHSDYSMGDYRPSAGWDVDLSSLQCLVEKWHVSRTNDLMKRLGEVDVVLLTVMVRHGADVFWNDLGAPLTPWLRDGGLLIVAGAREDADIGWLRNLHPAWAMSLGPCPTGMPGDIHEALRKPNPLADGLNEKPHDYGRLPAPIWPDVHWQHLESVAGPALVTCPCGKPLLVRCELGKGSVVAGTLSRGKGLDGRVFENLWAAHAERIGRQYAPRPERKTIAEILADYPGPAGEPNPNLRFDEQGTLMIDGAPFFPFGFYCVQRLESLKILGDNGFNCVFGGGKKYLDEALKHGIRSVASMSWDPREIPDSVAVLRSHPGLIGYGILEEPSNSPKSLHDMMLAADVIRKSDPDKPRFVLPNNPLVFGTVPGLGEFIIADPYCVRRPDSPLNRVAVDVRSLQELHPGKPVWTLLQAHRFGDHLIIPSPAQLRAMNYLAIVHGARGIMWFAFDDNGTDTSISFIRYADGHYEQPAWNTLCGLAAEVKEVTPWVVGPAAPELIASCGPDHSVHAAAWARGDDHLLIVVNSMPDAQTARLTLSRDLSLRASHFESPPLELSGTVLNIDLSGYGVGLYTLRD